MPTVSDETTPKDIEPEKIILEELTPPRRIISGLSSRMSISLAIIFNLFLALGLWYELNPESLARTLDHLKGEPLIIQSLILTVDHKRLEVLPHTTITLHPAQKITINALVSNRWLNYNLNLFSPDFDIATVTNGAEANALTLLGPKTFARARPGELRIVAQDAGQPVAEFKILTQYEAQDYVALGDATTNPVDRVKNYRKALALNPSWPKIRTKLATALLNAGLKDEAVVLYEDELAQAEASAKDILNRLLNFYTDPAQAKQRLSILNRLLILTKAENRSTNNLVHQLAETYIQSGRVAEAVEFLRTLLPEAGSETAAYLSELLLLYRQDGDTQHEIEILKQLLTVSSPEKAREIWTDLLALYETTADEQGRREALRSLVRLWPDGLNKANAYKNIGLLSVQTGDYTEAKEAFQTALKLDPADHLTRLNLARLANLTGDRQNYLANLEQLTQLAPDDLHYKLELAAALKTDNLNTRARDQYLEILKRHPENHETRLALIEILGRMKGETKTLLAQYAELTALRPKDTLALYNYGVLLFNEKQWSQAAEIFQKLLTLKPGENAANDYLLVIYQNQGREKEMLTKALELYRQEPKPIYLTLLLNTYENKQDWEKFTSTAKESVRLRPDDPESWQFLAKGQSRLKKNKEAAQSLWRAAETAGRRVDLWLATGVAFSDLGQTDPSHQAYEKVLTLDPENKLALQALSRLKNPADPSQETEGGNANSN